MHLDVSTRWWGATPRLLSFAERIVPAVIMACCHRDRPLRFADYQAPSSVRMRLINVSMSPALRQVGPSTITLSRARA
jgi:hypothetical protein